MLFMLWIYLCCTSCSTMLLSILIKFSHQHNLLFVSTISISRYYPFLQIMNFKVYVSLTKYALSFRLLCPIVHFEVGNCALQATCVFMSYGLKKLRKSKSTQIKYIPNAARNYGANQNEWVQITSYNIIKLSLSSVQCFTWNASC